MTAKLLTRTSLKRLLKIADDRLWNGNLALRDDGVYRLVPSDDLRSDLPEREFRAIGEPGLVLALPCTFEDFATFIDAEGLGEPYIERYLRLGRFGPVNQAGARAGTRVPGKPTMLANEESVLVALRRAGYDPLLLPPLKSGQTCPAKAAAKKGCGLGKSPFKHAWDNLCASKAIRRMARPIGTHPKVRGRG